MVSLSIYHSSLNKIDPDKSAIIRAFSRAAHTYDKSAAFQRDVALQLLDLIKVKSDDSVLDLGCGTGFCSQALAKRSCNVTALDFSHAMMLRTKKRCGDKISMIVGDAECLPFQDNHFDLVFSSLALQWCQDLSVPFRELQRVTKPQGQIVFSLLLEDSLIELTQSWKQIDNKKHVNDFISINTLKLVLAQIGFKSVIIESKEIVQPYPSAIALMKDLKGIGATHVVNGRKAGLRGSQTLRKLEKNYQTFKVNNGYLPATYQVGFGVINNE